MGQAEEAPNDENLVGNLEKAKQRKLEIKDAVAKFNFKVKHGMKAFIDLGVIVKDNAPSIAAFFYEIPG